MSCSQSPPPIWASPQPSSPGSAWSSSSTVARVICSRRRWASPPGRSCWPRYAARALSSGPRSASSSCSPPPSSTRSPRCSRCTCTASTTCPPSSHPGTGWSTSAPWPSGVRHWSPPRSARSWPSRSPPGERTPAGGCSAANGSTCWAPSGTPVCSASCSGDPPAGSTSARSSSSPTSRCSARGSARGNGRRTTPPGWSRSATRRVGRPAAMAGSTWPRCSPPRPCCAGPVTSPGRRGPPRAVRRWSRPHFRRPAPACRRAR